MRINGDGERAEKREKENEYEKFAMKLYIVKMEWRMLRVKLVRKKLSKG